MGQQPPASYKQQPCLFTCLSFCQQRPVLCPLRIPTYAIRPYSATLLLQSEFLYQRIWTKRLILPTTTNSNVFSNWSLTNLFPSLRQGGGGHPLIFFTAESRPFVRVALYLTRKQNRSWCSISKKQFKEVLLTKPKNTKSDSRPRYRKKCVFHMHGRSCPIKINTGLLYPA